MIFLPFLIVQGDQQKKWAQRGDLSLFFQKISKKENQGATSRAKKIVSA